MARKCQSKNPSQCPIHGLGGKQEQLHLDLNKALAKNDISKAVELRQQLDSLSDVVESKDKDKGSFFSRLKSGFTKTSADTVDKAPALKSSVAEEPYKGLKTDCGTCSSCDPDPSEITPYRHLSNGPCQRPVPMPVSEVAHKVLSKNFSYIAGTTPAQKEEIQNRVTAILEEPFNRQPWVGSDASRGAEEIRETIWHELYAKSGSNSTSVSHTGFTSAAITSDLFYALGREKELGWIEQDAPGYGHQIERDLRTESLFSSMQQVLSESRSGHAKKEAEKRETAKRKTNR